MKSLGWFLAGAICGALGLAAVLSQCVMIAVRPQLAAQPPSTSTAAPAAVAVTNDPVTDTSDWGNKWPTLTFPARPDRVPEGYQRKYDKFEDYTSFSTDIKIDGSVHVSLFAVAKGDVENCPVPPQDVGVAVYHTGERVHGRIVFIADEVRITTFDEEEGFDSASAKLRSEDLLKLVWARKVECRSDSHEVLLDEWDQRRLRMFASSLVPPTHGNPARPTK